MNRQRGFSLIELMAAVSVVTLVSGALAVGFRTLHEDDQLSAAYATDLAGLRRAVREIRADLRDEGIHGARHWKLEDQVLTRQGVVVARRIATLEIAPKAGRSEVTLALAPRSEAPGRRAASVTFAVRPLTAPGAPK